MHQYLPSEIHEKPRSGKLSIAYEEREGGREGGREAGRKGGREGGREGVAKVRRSSPTT